ncbi:hypothetical protein OSU72_29075 [Streptomyces sp. NA13]|nr:hypothetical protein OSU72_29075 [Streptomyces sp. NA13]
MQDQGAAEAAGAPAASGARAASFQGPQLEALETDEGAPGGGEGGVAVGEAVGVVQPAVRGDGQLPYQGMELWRPTA